MLGQRIVARLRERTYAAALRQEVEFVEKGEGDVLSRLSVDSSIVGERLVPQARDAVRTCSVRRDKQNAFVLTYYLDASVTQNLSDGLRSIVMASAGCECSLSVECNCSLTVFQWERCSTSRPR